MEVFIIHVQKEDCNHILSISCLKLYVRCTKSDFLRSSFSHRASILWNNLPMYLKSKPNIGSFKSALKEKYEILDKITFNGLQGINKDIVNYIY